MPLISVIIPCYNYGHYLPFTLESLQQQTYQNWECIIVDDGSADNTAQVAQEFINRDKRFTYLYQENKGISAARNTGILASQGEYIQLIDADDLIEFKKFECQVAHLEANPGYDIVYSPVRFFRTQFPTERLYSLGRVNKSWMPKLSGSGSPIVKFLVQNNIVATNCPLFRKKVFTQVGLFNPDLKVLEDWDFWLRCAQSNQYFFYLDQPDTFALVRVHGKSISNNTWEMRFIELKMKNELKEKLKEPELVAILETQITQVKKTLVAIALYDLVKGKVQSFSEKIKIISEKETVGSATVQIIKHKYLPDISLGKILFYGKKLIFKA